MPSQSYLRFLLAIVLTMAATWFVDWWTVPLVAAVYALIERADPWLPLRAALVGTIAWALLLLFQAPGGGVARIASAVGGVIGIGGFGVTLLTILFPALLAASAAGVVRAVVPAK
jgi:hypothetical protein